MMTCILHRLQGSYCTDVMLGDDQVTCTAPPGQGADINILVSVRGLVSQPVSFSYAAPVVSGVKCGEECPLGADVVISGSNFGTSATVVIAGTTCPVSTAASSHDSLVCSRPADIDPTLPLAVVVDVGGQTAEVTTAIVTPVVESYACPPSGCQTGGGDLVTIHGSNFGSVRANVTVTIGVRVLDTHVVTKDRARSARLSTPGEESIAQTFGPSCDCRVKHAQCFTWTHQALSWSAQCQRLQPERHLYRFRYPGRLLLLLSSLTALPRFCLRHASETAFQAPLSSFR